jgi:hypothetical protein
MSTLDDDASTVDESLGEDMCVDCETPNAPLSASVKQMDLVVDVTRISDSLPVATDATEMSAREALDGRSMAFEQALHDKAIAVAGAPQIPAAAGQVAELELMAADAHISDSTDVVATVMNLPGGETLDDCRTTLETEPSYEALAAADASSPMVRQQQQQQRDVKTGRRSNGVYERDDANATMNRNAACLSVFCAHIAQLGCRIAAATAQAAATEYLLAEGLRSIHPAQAFGSQMLL